MFQMSLSILYFLFFTASAIGFYILIKKYIEQQSQIQMLKNNIHNLDIQQQHRQATLPMRLPAYERLLLVCERISLPNLVGRLRTEGASAHDLRRAMFLAIYQEFEHNVTQQIYVSENLWHIVLLARDNTVNILDVVGEKVDKNATADVFIAELGTFLNAQTADSISQAQAAIRQEASSLLM